MLDISMWMPAGNNAETILVQCDGRFDQVPGSDADWAAISAASGGGVVSDLLCAHRAGYLLLPPGADLAAATDQGRAWFDQMNRIDGATELADGHPIHGVDFADVGTRPVTVVGLINGERLNVTGFLARKIADSCLYLTLTSPEGERLWSGSLRQRHLAVAAYSIHLWRAGLDVHLLEDAVRAGLSPQEVTAVGDTGALTRMDIQALGALRRFAGGRARWPHEETQVQVADGAHGWMAIWGASTGNRFDATTRARGYML